MNFSSVLILLLQKSVKSLQLKLNEFVDRIEAKEFITSSAFCQARRKLLPQAFECLNNVVLNFTYKDQDHKTFCGFEVIGVDGAEIRLPDSQSIRDAFGTLKYKAGSAQEEYCSAQFMVVYDCLNHIALRCNLGKSSVYEVAAFQETLQSQHITEVKNPFFVEDRGFAAYDHIAWHLQHNHNFVVRLTKQSFSAAQRAFADCAFQDDVVLVQRTGTSKINKKDVPESLSIRLVKVMLSNGAVELLATNVTQEQIPTTRLQELYNLRWGIETYFLII